VGRRGAHRHLGARVNDDRGRDQVQRSVYAPLLEAVKQEIASSRVRAARVVNTELIGMHRGNNARTVPCEFLEADVLLIDRRYGAALFLVYPSW